MNVCSAIGGRTYGTSGITTTRRGPGGDATLTSYPALLSTSAAATALSFRRSASRPACRRRRAVRWLADLAGPDDDDDLHHGPILSWLEAVAIRAAGRRRPRSGPPRSCNRT